MLVTTLSLIPGTRCGVLRGSQRLYRAPSLYEADLGSTFTVHVQLEKPRLRIVVLICTWLTAPPPHLTLAE